MCLELWIPLTHLWGWPEQDRDGSYTGVSLWRTQNGSELAGFGVSSSGSSGVPNFFGTRDWFRGRPFCHRPGGREGGFRMIQMHYIYHAVYFYYNYISFHLRSSGIRSRRLRTGKPNPAAVLRFSSRLLFRYSPRFS